ncbi:uncharacterized protein LOC5514974 isoform X2 [Nematostella vectensis]|uniref:uncharacterized protein LOC5514974 isoform X2 n=1 Tax=Nematostella vectensis TaxID=45351 RepID=UPI0020770D0A|nr:uncharacterized protein LOC5514974 isoform X2 [Nematostella vectensis]
MNMSQQQTVTHSALNSNENHQLLLSNLVYFNGRASFTEKQGFFGVYQASDNCTRMILLCVRVCCGMKVLFGPKWIGIEEDRTLCDLLRYATGDEFAGRKIQVVVSSENALKDISLATLSVPVTQLEESESRIVNFLLKPDEETDLNKTSCTQPESSNPQQTPPREMQYHTQPMYPPTRHMINHHPAHYPPHGYAPPYHPSISQRHHCPCPQCTMDPTNPHGSHGDHMVPGYYGYHGFPYYGPVQQNIERPTMPVESLISTRPHPEQRPVSVHGDQYESIVKGGTPLYGQPPWWRWGPGDDSLRGGTAVSLSDRGDSMASQHMVTMRPQRHNEDQYKRHTIGTVAVLEDSHERVLSQVTPWQNYHSLSSSPRRETIPARYDRPDKGAWEYAMHREAMDDRGQFEDCDTEQKRQNGRQNRQSMAFEIPIIPEYGEIPEKPVSEKPTRLKGSSKSDKNRAIIRSKTITKSRPRPLSDTETYSKKKGAGRRLSSVSQRGDTSESECERSFRGKRSSPSEADGVFGLTEIDLDKVPSNGQVLSSPGSMVLPKWVEQWARTMQSGNGGKESASSPISRPESDGRTRGVSTGANNTQDSRSSTPRTPRSTQKSSTLDRRRTASPASTHSNTRSATLPRSFRNRTHATLRLRMSAGSDADTRKNLRARSMVSTTSDDSEGERSDTSFSSHQTTPEREGSVTRRIAHRPTSAPVTLPRGNKTTMLRAQNSREALKTNSSSKASKAKQRHSSGGSLSDDKTSHARIWTPGTTKTKPTTPTSSHKMSSRSSTAEDVQRSKGLSQADLDTQAAVEALFSASLPADFRSSRNESTNKTFVLDEGDQQANMSSSEDTAQEEPDSTRRSCDPHNAHDRNTGSSSSSDVDKSSLIKALTKFQNDKSNSSLPTWSRSPDHKQKSMEKSRTPKTVDKSVIPRNLENVLGNSQQDKNALRPVSPDSLVSVPPAASPSPPSTPRSSAKKALKDRVHSWSAGSSQSRRTWDVTEKPVEDLMLASIHAFTVELRLASESALSKVRALYEQNTHGSNGVASGNKSSTAGSEEKHTSSIPDWKSSHAEIAGVFRNLRRVEFSLKTMDQALSVLCTEPADEVPKERKISVVERVNKSPHKWQDFKVRARKASWAVEHRDQFPVPSSDEDDDTS